MYFIHIQPGFFFQTHHNTSSFQTYMFPFKMKCTDLVGAALLHMGVYGLATNVNMSSPNLLGTNKTGRSCIKKKKH